MYGLLALCVRDWGFELQTSHAQQLALSISTQAEKLGSF